MNLIVIPNKYELKNYLDKNIKSFIFGLKDFSINYYEIDIVKLKSLKEKYQDIKIYIAINKMIFNADLKVLEELLLEIDKLNIGGILFYDLSILSLKNRLGLKTPLIWHQTHFVTNYNTCNYFYDKGCKYGVISSEITKDEMIEIKNNTKMELMVYIMGHSIISHSRRKLLTNYFSHNDTTKKEEHYKLKQRTTEDTYLINEDKNGTNIYSNKILNGSRAFISLIDNGFDNFIIDNHFISDLVFLKVIDLYQELVTSSDKESILEKIEKLIGNYTGFLYLKTIYKVKS